MTRILDRLTGPEELKNLELAELNQLAREIRQQIIETVAQTGGHLSSNLGVVELTIALHSVLNCPQDKIVWDVGHQSYVHKLLTGRREQFTTLRQYGGLSGFPKRYESEYDIFGAGHSSTSISAALGLAQARDLNGQDYRVVAVIGDGSLTGGMSFEALNHAGHMGTNLTVILNDNEMSISPNVGALSSYLNRLRVDPHYSELKEDVEYLLRKIPAIGGKVFKAAERIKDTMKYLMVSGALFGELGFRYIGPVDGHNMGELRRVLWHACRMNGPVLVHVLTLKGKGYAPAEKNPDAFHGVGPFDIPTGKSKKQAGRATYTQVFGDTLLTLAKEDPKIVAITAAMMSGTGLTEFAKTFPSRFFDVGIAEQHAVTMAAGMAAGGLKPVVAVYSTFLQRAYDQIIHDVCLQNIPVTFAIDRGGLVGEDGPTHHGVFDFTYLRHIPNMVVMAPKDENELQQMLVTAVKHNGPCALRYPRGAGVGVPLNKAHKSLPIGKAERLNEGKTVAILAIGSMVYPALEAARQLAVEGIRPTVINARFVKPLDHKMLMELAQSHHLWITVEEHALAGGFGSAVLEWLEINGIDSVRVCRMGIPDRFIEHGPTGQLLEDVGLTVEGIMANVKKLAGGVRLVR